MRFVLHSAVHARAAQLAVRQDGRLLLRDRTLLLPGRSVRLAAGRIGRVDPGGGPVHVNVRLGRRFRSGSGGARTTASIALEAVLGRHRPAWPDAAAALIAGQAA